MNEQMGRSMAEAMMWVSKITTACGVMVVPGAAGMWLDGRLGTSPLFALSGLLFGMVGGLYMLVQFVQPKKESKDAKNSGNHRGSV